MLKFVLVRHGLTEWNQEGRYLGSSDVGLSEQGKIQAALLAPALDNFPIDVIYSSPLKRSVETAKQTGEHLGIEVTIDDRLRELNFGIFEGLTFQQAQGNYPDQMRRWLDDYNQPPENGETISSLVERVSGFLKDTIVSNEGKCVLVFSHGGVLREILRQSLDLKKDQHWAFEIAPAGITELIVSGDGVRVKCLNDTCHLEAGMDSSLGN